MAGGSMGLEKADLADALQRQARAGDGFGIGPLAGEVNRRGVLA